MGMSGGMSEDAFRRAGASMQIHELLRILSEMGADLITGDPEPHIAVPQASLGQHGIGPGTSTRTAGGSSVGGGPGPSTLSGADTGPA